MIQKMQKSTPESRLLSFSRVLVIQHGSTLVLTFFTITVVCRQHLFRAAAPEWSSLKVSSECFQPVTFLSFDSTIISYFLHLCVCKAYSTIHFVHLSTQNQCFFLSTISHIIILPTDAPKRPYQAIAPGSEVLTDSFGFNLL